MIFAIVLDSRSAAGAETRCEIPRRQFAAKYRIIAQYSSQRPGAWAVTILETAALPSCVMESAYGDMRVRAIPVGSQQEGFDLARRIIQRRNRMRPRGEIAAVTATPPIRAASAAGA